MDERQPHRSYLPAVDPPPTAGDAAWWFAIRHDELLVVESGPSATTVSSAVDLDELGLAPLRRQYLGTLDGRPCWSAELADGSEPPPGMAFRGLRTLYGRLDETVYGIAGRATQVVAWDRDHRFCGRCATPTERVPTERARRCPACGLTVYPRLSPAVIVLIERGEEILLARGHRFPPGRFGIVAGFVETGESLEEAVRREVTEEVGLALAEVRYFGSQPWPFPHAVMIGFTAAWAGGEIRVDERELAEAGWFGVANLPTIPPQLSIARRLIDDWAARRGGAAIDQE